MTFSTTLYSSGATKTHLGPSLLSSAVVSSGSLLPFLLAQNMFRRYDKNSTLTTPLQSKN
jgi:hypothetical protein